MSENDIIDRIDALVDEQLSNYGNRSGYDHNVNQERCRCGRDWHGLPITKRIDGMRSLGQMDPGYSEAQPEPTEQAGNRMSKQEFRSEVLAELREVNATLRRIAAVVELDSKAGPVEIEVKPYEVPMGPLTDDDAVGVEIDGKVFVERWGDIKPGIRP